LSSNVCLVVCISKRVRVCTFTCVRARERERLLLVEQRLFSDVLSMCLCVCICMCVCVCVRERLLIVEQGLFKGVYMYTSLCV